MIRLVISIPQPLKAKLDALRSQGYTAAGFIRHVLEEKFSETPKPHKRRSHR